MNNLKPWDYCIAMKMASNNPFFVRNSGKIQEKGGAAGHEKTVDTCGRMK